MNVDRTLKVETEGSISYWNLLHVRAIICREAEGRLEIVLKDTFPDGTHVIFFEQVTSEQFARIHRQLEQGGNGAH